MTELQIQAAICRYLQSCGVFFHSVPNEAAGRNPVAQMQLVTIGLRAGVADLVVWWADGIGYLEVKTATGKQSKRQEAFEKKCRDYGVAYDLARSVDDVGKLLRIHHGVGIAELDLEEV
jgi:hypothetical protein